MTLWKKLRIPFLAVILGSIILILMKVFLTTNINKPKPDQSDYEYQHQYVFRPINLQDFKNFLSREI
jgi:hypothetical protein